jgi:hypothetical protein
MPFHVPPFTLFYTIAVCKLLFFHKTFCHSLHFTISSLHIMYYIYKQNHQLHKCPIVKVKCDKADSHIVCRAHAVPMPCRDPAMLRQCRVLRESPRGSRKYPN